MSQKSWLPFDGKTYSFKIFYKFFKEFLTENPELVTITIWHLFIFKENK